MRSRPRIRYSHPRMPQRTGGPRMTGIRGTEVTVHLTFETQGRQREPDRPRAPAITVSGVLRQVEALHDQGLVSDREFFARRAQLSRSRATRLR
jgi:hypothetical protein